MRGPGLQELRCEGRGNQRDQGMHGPGARGGSEAWLLFLICKTRSLNGWMMTSSCKTAILYDLRNDVQTQASVEGHFRSQGPGMLGRMTKQKQQDPGETAAFSGDQVTWGHRETLPPTASHIPGGALRNAPPETHLATRTEVSMCGSISCKLGWRPRQGGQQVASPQRTSM